MPISNSDHVGLYKVSTKAKIEPFATDNGKIVFNVKVKITGEVVETQPRRKITNKEKRKIEEEAKGFTKSKIENLLDKLQAMNSDPVGFGGKYRIAYPREWEKIDWHQTYPGVTFNVETEVSIKSTGLFR